MGVEMNLLVAFAIAGLASLFSPSAVVEDVHGAGATFPFPLYERWASAYKAEAGVTIRYESNGSGLGIKLVKARTVVFGGTDMPLAPAELAENGLLQFPTAIGGDVPVVNVPGIRAGDLLLDGPTLADIFLGKVARWNDPAIQKLNPNLNLPGLAISVVHRSDGSGTTFVWTDYLSKVSREWRDKLGAGTAVDWPVGVGARGNEGVASNVAQIAGAIGYVEFTYATRNRLSFTRMVNRSGKAVTPSLASFGAAAAGADWSAAPQFHLVLTDEPGDEVWPIAGATFILMPLAPRDPTASAEALKFFRWAFAKGDDIALRLNYVPMPDTAVSLIEASWSRIRS